ncbi:Sulfatase-modifying factor enzyme domain-containing protein [Vibrio crassostreae]|nr:Sulfatase-modifying factor enzyme domain-containing protein [Vibrio crassostreae]CAK2915849.1 Sulfatase-modifying factor enzyme domain-containing protein [Vibrio crassostreae]CAK2945425.1 Sulfatase-modifying factor enzyme domain-containing protein [Vibrio crassostreae]CAK2946359.1 Sulfatase-modifying factor enzyme domain-containing protein [Vibrio crassostreae]CAK2950768.1 Sulfatase-modifying factor enzyme domain-containing protein [Vibrio crassostreae]
MKVINVGVIALGISALTACGGGSGDSDSSSPSIQPSIPSDVSIEASVIQSKALVNIESQTVVTVDTDIDFRLTSVKQVNHGATCEITSVEGMSFTTLSSEIGECQFEYTIEPVAQDVYTGQASSFARVSVSETAEENTLPNLSETTNIEIPVTIDLSEELESDLDTSTYSVSQEVTLLGSGSVEVDSINNTITYTPLDIGVTRIMYSMSDGSSTKLGNIDVAVSDTGNTPPTANDYVREGKLAKDMSVEIDLTDYVSDAEDSVILDSVRAYNAETEITSATEHTFTFQSSEAGAHEVAYTIKDGRGGYAVGQVYIEVEPDFSLVQDWDDITIYDSTIGADLTFTAPASKVLADYTNTAYTSYQEQDGVTGPKYSEVVTMNLEQANNYCASRNGRLPISREWELLLADQGNLFKSDNWPAGTLFWTADMVSEISANSFNAADGSTTELLKSEDVGFTTCVMFDNEVIQDFTTTLEYSFINGVKFSLVGVITDPDGNIAPYQNVTLVAEKNKGVFSNYQSTLEVVTDGTGEIDDFYTDTSFNNAVLSGYSSASKVDSITFKSEAAASRLDLLDDSKWERLAAEEELLKPLASFGMPILDGRSGGENLRTINVYQQEYTGDNFVVYIKVEDAGGLAPQNGRFSFAIQQESSQPSREWGDNNWPSSPQTSKSFEVINDYWYQNAKVVSGWDLEDQTNMDLSTPERHLWIQVNDGMLEIYNSATSDKPETPTYKNNMNWSDINPNQTYWIQIGSRIYTGHDAAVGIDTYVTDAYFTNY